MQLVLVNMERRNGRFYVILCLIAAFSFTVAQDASWEQTPRPDEVWTTLRPSMQHARPSDFWRPAPTTLRPSMQHARPSDFRRPAPGPGSSPEPQWMRDAKALCMSALGCPPMSTKGFRQPPPFIHPSIGPTPLDWPPHLTGANGPMIWDSQAPMMSTEGLGQPPPFKQPSIRPAPHNGLPPHLMKANGHRMRDFQAPMMSTEGLGQPPPFKQPSIRPAPHNGLPPHLMKANGHRMRDFQAPMMSTEGLGQLPPFKQPSIRPAPHNGLPPHLMKANGHRMRDFQAQMMSTEGFRKPPPFKQPSIRPAPHNGLPPHLMKDNGHRMRDFQAPMMSTEGLGQLPPFKQPSIRPAPHNGLPPHLMKANGHRMRDFQAQMMSTEGFRKPPQVKQPSIRPAPHNSLSPLLMRTNGSMLLRGPMPLEPRLTPLPHVSDTSFRPPAPQCSSAETSFILSFDIGLRMARKDSFALAVLPQEQYLAYGTSLTTVAKEEIFALATLPIQQCPVTPCSAMLTDILVDPMNPTLSLPIATNYGKQDKQQASTHQSSAELQSWSLSQRSCFLGGDTWAQPVWESRELGGDFTKTLPWNNVDSKLQKWPFQATVTESFNALLPQVITLSPGTSLSLPVSFRPPERYKYLDTTEFQGKEDTFQVSLQATVPCFVHELTERVQLPSCAAHHGDQTTFTFHDASELRTGAHWELGIPVQLSSESGVLAPGKEAQVTVLLRPLEVCVYQLKASCAFGDQGEKSCSMLLLGMSMFRNTYLETSTPGEKESSRLLEFGTVAFDCSQEKHFEICNPSPVNSSFHLSHLQHPPLLQSVFDCSVHEGLAAQGSSLQVPVRFSPVHSSSVEYLSRSSPVALSKQRIKPTGSSSVLLCRGKASNDFSGPDCRFLSFKKGETIYVYYKLSGQRSDVWAGSVGSRFGYFPKELLTINHIYTEKEIEVSAEETDFVCFDSGLDKFESYNIDQLLSYSESQVASEDASVESTEIEDTPTVTEEVVSSQDDTPPERDRGDIVEEESEHFLREPDPEELSLGPSDTSFSDDEEAANTSETSMAEQDEEENPKDDTDVHSENSAEAESSDKVTVLKPDIESTEQIAKAKKELNGIVDSWSTEHVHQLFEDEKEPKDGSPLDPEDPNPDVPGDAEPLDDDLIFEEGGESIFGEDSLDQLTEEAPSSQDDDKLEEDEKTAFIQSPMQPSEAPSENSTEAKSSDQDKVTEVKRKIIEQLTKAKKELTGIVDSRGIKHVHHPSENEAEPKDRSLVDAEVPKPDIPGDEKPLNDDLIFEEGGESLFGEEGPFSQDDEMEDDETTGPTQSPEQPKDVPSEGSGEAKSSNQITELKYDSETTEQIAKAKKELTGVVDSWATEPAHHQSEDKITELKYDSETTEQIAKAKKELTGIVDSWATEPAHHQSEDKITELKYDSETTEQIAKAKKELTGIVDSWATEPAHHQSEDKITELKYDSETIEQIATAKKELTGIVDSWATEPAHLQTEDKEEPKDLEEDPYHEELLEDENAMLSNFADTQEEGEKGDLTREAVEAEAVPDAVLSPPAPSPVEPDARTTEVPSTDESSSSSDAENITSDESSSSMIDAENITDTTDPESSTTVPNEPEYSDSVLRLTLIRDHFKDQEMERFQKFLSLKHLIRIEAMFQDLEQELKSVRLSPTDSSEDIERTLEAILEASETSILDEIEKMLDSREHRNQKEMEASMFDEEAAILDDFQELAFTLRQKYSTVSDSVPLVAKHEPVTEEADLHEVVEDSVNNFTVTEPDEPNDIGKVEHQHTSEPSTHGNLPHSPDLDIEEDGGHRNKDSQASPKEPDEIQIGPQAILENPLDVEFGVPWEVERPPSDFQEDGPKSDTSSTSVFAEMRSTLQFISQYWQYIGQYAEMLVATLPEEWRPGPNFHGLPWEPVLVTVAVGILTLIAFFWKTILAVRSRRYQITEKQLSERIKKMFNEKSETAIKMAELKKQAIEWEKRLKDSEKSQKSLLQENKELKKMLKEVNEKQKVLTEKMKTQDQTLDAEQRRMQGMKDTLSKSNQTVESLQQGITSYQKELAKVQILMDESKLREDALKAEMKASEKENNKLKELKNSLQRDLKEWEEKHKDLNEKIRVFQRTQKELEDALAHKENEIDIMTDCIAELRSLEALEADDSHGDKGLANGDTTAAKRNETMRAHIKQMMDVSRVKATLSVIEDERNRFMAKLLEEEKIRQNLEEQVQKLEHDRSELESDKSQLENQHKTLEQKLEIMSEMYQQKESALHQKLTREELDRKEKESKLSEVDKKTLKAAEEVEIHKRRIQEIEEEMEKTERFNKNLIASLEKKSHDNWLAARAAERALTEEKRESARLRQSLQVTEEKIHEKYRSLPKPASVHADHALRRGGDSYGPSPVSGGAPSPPPMIDGPGRPPSAPVGRRSEPLGPRPPSDPHGRYADHGYAPPPRHDMYAPRTSSPTDGSQTAPVPVEAEAEASTETPDAISRSQGPGSLLVSPIRDSPGPIMPPKGHGPPPPGGRPPMGPAPPNGLPPPMMRPNGHPPMKSPAPMGHEPRFGPPPHLSDPHFGPPGYGPRPGPMSGPPYGPLPPPFMRGPTPPMRDYPPMGPAYGPDYPYPPRHPSPGAMLPPPGAMPPGAMPHPGMMPPLPPHGERDFRGPPPGHGYVPPEIRNSQGDVRLDSSAKTDNFSQQAPGQQDSASMVLDP
ncbi:transport and Golgi organization protein 1 homolog isoform X3 [Alosa sapidissima]|uniref:transport and Golgi organization protein 1 homolog isoform X3 n=1 Tax=Alosa sapidissima TaxID=34773 RepID=UPI001C083A3B|nr:transport and Golgi organization protein 1 homolog isoform X3 [Alosa sapidissima]